MKALMVVLAALLLTACSTTDEHGTTFSLERASNPNADPATAYREVAWVIYKGDDAQVARGIALFNSEPKLQQGQQQRFKELADRTYEKHTDPEGFVADFVTWYEVKAYFRIKQVAPERQREVAQIAWVDFLKRHPEVADRLANQERAAAERAAMEERILGQLAAARIEAAEGSRFSCRSEQECKKAFSLAQIYVNQSADMKIQLATDTIIETYNATEDGKIAAKATKVPGPGESAVIQFDAMCHKCDRIEQWRAYKAMAGFKVFVAENLKQ